MNPEEKISNQPEVKEATEPESVAEVPEVASKEPELKLEEVDTPTVASEATAVEQPVSQTLEASKQAMAWLAQLPAKLAKLWQDTFGEQKNKSTVTTVALILAVILAAILAFVISSKVVNIINGIPLLGPVLELVGLAYVIWFTFRYLLLAQARQELFSKIQGFKESILG